jgi:hypothetical protein
MWPFRRKTIVDADTAAWHLENFRWLLQEFGPAAFARTQLVLPKPGYFKADGKRDHNFGVSIFDQVKNYCGMNEWEVDLVVDDNPLAVRTEISRAMVEPQKHALGTFGVAGNRIQISYVPDLLERPDHLIATFAHELAHYFLATARSQPPCADDEMEFLTDFTAVYLGFGIFLANARFNFEGQTHGWRMARSGYLPEADLIFALMLFIEANGVDPNLALSCLKPHLAAMLRRGLRRRAPLIKVDVRDLDVRDPDRGPS